MIDYQTFHEIRRLRDQEQLSAAQIAAALQQRPAAPYLRPAGVVVSG